MVDRFRFYSLLFLATLAYLSYDILLSSKGYFEREELKKQLTELEFELDRLRDENRGLLERKKSNANDSLLLEKEARKYYLIKKDSTVIKFIDSEGSNDWEDRDQRIYWKKLWAGDFRGEKIPPLDVLRVFHISFSIFLCLGVYFHLGKKKQTEEDPGTHSGEHSGSKEDGNQKSKS
jgi:cell division protein FtsB